MDSFHYCTKEGCNRKYKSEANLQKHLLTCTGPQQFFHCDKEGCTKKYKSQEKLDKHKIDCKGLEGIFVCTVNGCTRQYKRKEALDKHISSHVDARLHLAIDSSLNSSRIELFPCPINGCNRKYKRKEALEGHIEYHGRIKNKKDNLMLSGIELQNSGLQLQNSILELQKSILERVKENPQDCAICMDEESDTACIPCGHKNFCYNCIKKCKESNGTCPICRSGIERCVKIFD